VRNKDGERFMGTCDYKPNRINVVVENDFVTDVTGIG